MRSKTLNIWCLVLSTYIILSSFGCGGGGGGGGGLGGGISYTGLTTQAHITSDNANKIFSVVWNGGSSSAVSSSSPPISKAVSSEQSDDSGIIPIVKHISNRLSSDISNFSNGMKGIRRATPINETDNGSVSGTRTITGSIDENTGTGTLTLTYTNFNDGNGYTYDGAITVKVDGYDIGYGIITDMTMSFTLWTIKTADSDMSISGSIRWQESLSNNSITLTMNIDGRDNIRNETFRLENFVLTTIYNNLFSPTSASETGSGRVYVEKYGYVDVSTASPLIYTYPQDVPNSGGPIILTGAANSKARITPFSTVYVSIDVDADGDGTFESSNIYLWDDLEGTPVSLPPMVSSTNPSYGAIGVAVNSAISATFSEAMDASTINTTTFTVSTGGSNISGTVTYDATNKVATFTPLANLAYSTTYTATITTGVKDLAGNMMAANYAWSFTTGSIPPNPPTNVTATAGDGQVIIAWTFASDAMSYNIYWSTTPGVTKVTGTKIPVYYYSYTHTGLNNGTTYYYVVTSINFYGMESNESNEVSATPQAGATTPLTNDATNITDTTATFNGSFNNPSGYTTTVWFEYGTTTSYGSTTTPVAYATTGTIPLSINITSLQQATTYHYRIVTQNSGGTFYGNDKSFKTYITPQVLATGLTNPMDISVDSANVYWMEGGYPGTVKKVGINGGTVTTLASNLNTSYGGGKIAVDSTSVYWTESGNTGNDGAVKKVGIDGGAITTLASGLSNPSYVAVDSTSVYWIEGGNVKKISKDGGTVTTIASGSNYPSGIAVDSTSVYWAEYGAVKKVGIDGGIVTTIALASGGYGAIAVDASYVYWNDVGSLRKVGINGGTVTTLATDYCNDIATDATSVYWTSGGAVKKVSVNGGTVTTLVVEQTSLSPITIDAASVYYIGGTWTELMIKKLPKSY